MPPQGSGSYCWSFRPDLHAATVARRALNDLSPTVDPDLLERCRLTLTEVVTNSVKHARLRPSQPIDVQIRVSPARVRIEVTDDGPGFDPPAVRPDSNLAAGGWGLWLVDQLTDRWGVDRSHSASVWLEFDRASE